jgi:hypothetical protein
MERKAKTDGRQSAVAILGERIIHGGRIADREEMPMAKLLLLLAIACAFASFAFYTANGAVGDAPNWASAVCTAARSLCHSPRETAIAAAVLAGLWILITFLSSVRD